MINLEKMDNVSIDLLSRKEEDGGLSDKCFELIARINNDRTIVYNYPNYRSRRCKHGCNECITVNIGCALIVVCVKEQKCTVVALRKH